MKYIPSLMFVAIWIAVRSATTTVEILILTHFGKRALEVLFLHSFAGSPIEDCVSSFFIGIFYAFTSWLYMRQGTQAEGPLLIFGLALFVIGIAGNFYHHFLLRSLRTQKVDSSGSALLLAKGPDPPTDENNAARKYAIPQGGLFEITTCPHYFFEILGFWGIALAACNLNAFLCAAGTTSMLAGHSMATTSWYVSKFGDAYPKTRKHLIPFVF